MRVIYITHAGNHYRIVLTNQEAVSLDDGQPGPPVIPEAMLARLIRYGRARLIPEAQYRREQSPVTDDLVWRNRGQGRRRKP
jgi:hypothetical protein